MAEQFTNKSWFMCLILSDVLQEASQISVSEAKTADGACYLELKIPSKSNTVDGFWNFLEKYGFRYSDGFCRALLPSEVSRRLLLLFLLLDILKELIILYIFGGNITSRPEEATLDMCLSGSGG